MSGQIRKTKIVCTLGLASQTPEVIEKLMDAGMDVARFNFSHGTHESHKKTFEIVKKLREEKAMPVATLLDTKGPEIRLGMFENDRATLKEGASFVLTGEEVLGNCERAMISFSDLAGDVFPGAAILLDDGLIELQVERIQGRDIHCKVLNGGPISNRKGVNVPGVRLSLPYLSERDKEDILFGLKTGFDFIAASFVRGAQDVLEVRQILHDQGCDNVLIISKIENREGVDNIDDILRVSDGIMVARGDMGVEIPFAELPALQKMLIQKAYNCGKIVITATQMLESMINNPRPTRAETSDVANAIYDGTSAIMLSGETAAGLYPVQAARTMAAIALQTERDINYRKRFSNAEYAAENDNITNAISHATCTTAYDLGAAAIITVSMSGRTARSVSKYRSDIPIIGCTVSESTWRQLSMSWGVVPVMLSEENDIDRLFDAAVDAACKQGLVNSGELVVITTGVPLGISGTTNLLKVHIAGDVLVMGKGINELSACGSLCVAHSEQEALKTFRQGDILVISETTNALLPILRQAKGIVAEQGGSNSHAAVVGLALEIPVIVGAAHATNLLKGGTIVSVDAARGVVSGAGKTGLAGDKKSKKRSG